MAQIGSIELIATGKPEVITREIATPYGITRDTLAAFVAKGKEHARGALVPSVKAGPFQPQEGNDKQFHMTAVSDLLAYLLYGTDYIVVSTNSRRLLRSMVRSGYTPGDVFGDQHFVPLVGLWLDKQGKRGRKSRKPARKGYLVLVDERAGITSLDDVAIHTHMTKLMDALTCAKRLKRLLASSYSGNMIFSKAINGVHELSYDAVNQISTCRFGNRNFRIKYDWSMTDFEAEAKFALAKAEIDVTRELAMASFAELLEIELRGKRSAKVIAKLTEENAQLRKQALDILDRQLWNAEADLDYRNAETKANVDGHIDLTIDSAGILAELIYPGQAYRFGKIGLGHAVQCTVGTPHGLGKGHTRIVRDMDGVDMIIHGPKAMVTTDMFLFGCMNVLHATIPCTDLQAILNFQFTRKGMMDDLSIRYFRYVNRIAHSEEELTKGMRATLLTKTQGDVFAMDQKELQEHWDDLNKKYVLRGFYEKNVSPFSMYMLYWKSIQYLLNTAMSAERGRIPMQFGIKPDGSPEGVAINRYGAGEPMAVNGLGQNTSKRLIPKGCICCPDLPVGWVVLYRQPSENRNAFVIVWNMHIPEYMSIKGTATFYEGEGSSISYRRLGGRDNDDNITMVYDPYWVEMFRQLLNTSYPEWGPLTPEDAPQDEVEMSEAYLDALACFEEDQAQQGAGIDVKNWNARHTETMIDVSYKTGDASIGRVVNDLFVDEACSEPNQKNAMLEYMEKEFADVVQGRPKQYWIDWLKQVEPHRLRKYATYLELIIDAQAKDPKLSKPLGDVPGALTGFEEGQKVYPSFMWNRIPGWKQALGDYVLADCEVDHMLARIEQRRMALEDTLKKFGVLLVQQVPDFVVHEVGFVADPSKDEHTQFVHDLVHGQLVYTHEERKAGIPELEGRNPWERGDGLRPLWKQLHAEARGQSGDMQQEDWQSIEDQITDFLEPYMEDIEQIAHVLYCYFYRNTLTEGYLSEDGRQRGHNDALLGHPVIAEALLSLFEANGLLGERYVCDFFRHPGLFRQLTLQVRVEKGVVFDLGTNQELGLSVRCPDSDPEGYPMVGGVIEVRPPANFLLAPDHLKQLPATDIDTVLGVE